LSHGSSRIGTAVDVRIDALGAEEFVFDEIVVGIEAQRGEQ
jgi:hypothetical protein